MSNLQYQIKFHTYWHVGSGLSAGAKKSLVVLKDENNLPLIPGKTLKGLLRDSAQKINSLNSQLVSQDFIGEIFGVGDDMVEKRKDMQSNSGRCFFSNARLSKSLSDRILQNNYAFFLYEDLASTAIDKKGLAKEHSLRITEVTIPLILYGFIEDFPNEKVYLDQLDLCFKWIKRMGLNRHRGLGQCEFSRINDLTT